MTNKEQGNITFERLITKNREWAHRVSADDPDFFSTLARQQKPGFLWIGCSDSRVPANQVVDLAPGEVFVHRNVANVVVPSDLNAVSVIQYAVDVLKVRDIIVTGHYGCGGVTAALKDQRVGLCDHWIAHVRDVYAQHRRIVQAQADDDARLRLLCELNAVEQALNLSHLLTVLDAWKRGQSLCIHALCYGLDNGLVNDLGVAIDRPVDVTEARAKAVAHLLAREGRRSDRAA